MKENPLRSAPGIPMLLGLLAVLGFGAYLIYTGANTGSVAWAVLVSVVLVVGFFCLFGLYMVEPNQAAVLSLFGKYVGTVKDSGLR